MEDELDQRLARNEAVFRQINEGIERGHWPGEENRPIGFRCECARLGCAEVVEMSVNAYEQVRAHSRRFFVVRGHERPELERVVDSTAGYLVVEKIDQAGAEAITTDPRG